MAINGTSNSYVDLLRLQQQEVQTTGTNQSTQQTDTTTIFDSELTTESTQTMEDIESEYTSAAAAAGVTSTSSVSETSGVEESEEAKKIREEIEELEEEKEENIEKMEKLEKQIEELAKSAEENIMKAAAAQEAAVNEHEEETQAVLDEQIQAYINANKEGGEGMTRDELQENIKGALPNTPEIADAVAALTAASEEVNEIDSCLSELNKLITDTQRIEDKIEAKQGEYDTAMQEAEEAAASSSCDPIGFTVNDAQYDFIVDDGAFDSTSDFLGADGQWSDMTALDTDGDGLVTAAELQAGNIKAVKTNADGSQEIVDLAEEFGEDFYIDLSSYQEGGSHSAIDTTSDHDGDGTADQSLLGTFNVNINGETVSGYNTLDDTDWLEENYGLTSSTTETETEGMQYSEDLQPHVNFFEMYTEKSEELKEQISEGFENLGISQEQIRGINETTKKEADENAKNFFASIGLEDEIKANEDNNIDTTETATSEEEEEAREEELLAEYAA